MSLSNHPIQKRLYANRYLADNAGSNRAELSKPKSAKPSAEQTRAAMNAQARAYYAKHGGGISDGRIVTGPDGYVVNQHQSGR